MLRQKTCFRVVLAGILVSACGLGCGGGDSLPRVTPSSRRLSYIAAAYMKATDSLEHPPRNKDELVPFLKGDSDADDPDKPAPDIDLDDLFKDYVINWGADFRDLGVQRRKLPVLAYEKEGKDGKRVVAQGRYVHTVTDEQFADLPFPPGFRAP